MYKGHCLSKCLHQTADENTHCTQSAAPASSVAWSSCLPSRAKQRMQLQCIVKAAAAHSYLMKCIACSSCSMFASSICTTTSSESAKHLLRLSSVGSSAAPSSAGHAQQLLCKTEFEFLC